MFKSLAIALAVLCLGAPCAYAQFETAALVGTVTDSSGAFVADAVITNFRAPNGNRSAAAFGTITQTYDPRQVQFGLKVMF